MRASAPSANVLLAKARAMYGHSLKAQNFSELLSCHSVSEVAAYLKNNTAYATVLREINEATIHRGHLEMLLRRKQFNDYSSLCRYDLTVDMHMADYIIRRSEVEQIVQCLRLISAGRSDEFFFSMPLFFASQSRLDFMRMGAAKTQEALVEALGSSPYARLIRQFPPENGQIRLTAIENALYTYLYNTLLAIIDETKGELHEQLVDLCGTQLDAQNVSRIVRMKRYFHMPPEVIRANLLPYGRCIPAKMMDRLIDAPDAQEVLRLFGEWAHPTGLQHGTVTVVSGGLPIELTTMRRDGAYRDNRHPDSVTFGTSIEEDLARRDFTVNAIALSPDGTLVDPYGGQEDLKAGVLRCVGEPKRRFEEDALRILRLVRFCSVLGFSAEKETARAAHEARGLLAHVAHERVYTEMNKLLLGEDVGETLLTFPDILGVPIPEILPCVGFDQCNYHHCFDVWGHTARAVAAVPPKRELRWTMLFHDLGKPLCRTFDEQGVGHFYGHTAISAQMAEDIMARLHFEKALRDRIRAQLACFDDMFRPERAAIHKEMARLGAETVQNLLYTKQADNAAKAPAGLERAQALWHEAQKIYDELISEGACCSIHGLKISGEDLAALGYHGREIGAVLARLLDEVASEKLKNTPAALRARAVRLWRSGYARHTMKENETH